MKEFLLMVCSFLRVADFASPEYAVRDAAQQDIERWGHAALPALEWGQFYPDCEVRCRCDYGIFKYYEQCCSARVNVAPIWCLPSSRRYDAKGNDLALYYYCQAFEQSKKWKGNLRSYTDDNIAKLATKLFWYEQLRQSDCRTQIGQDIVDMESNHDRVQYFDLGEKEKDEHGVPIPIEKRIEYRENGTYGEGGG